MSSFREWLHHLFNPHCEKCEERAREKQICQSCETLKSELTAVRWENQELIKALMRQLEPASVDKVAEPQETPRPVNSGLNWHWRRQELQRQDRAEAEIRRNKIKEQAESNKTTEQLERELKLGDDDASKVS